DAFFQALPMTRPTTPIDSCAVAGPMPVDVAGIRRLAVEQWASPVAFRATIEAMHEAGVRVFVEVGARGNLTGFVEDTLRGRPHFAIAANLPRRSGLTQLNHLVAALYAQGVAIKPDHLYARRRPRTIDLSAEYRPPKPGAGRAVGFPAMQTSDAPAARLPEPGRPSTQTETLAGEDSGDQPFRQVRSAQTVAVNGKPHG